MAAEKIDFFSLPHGFTIFCDDIRFEASGKQSFMGVYNAIMMLRGPFPHTVPRLCFSAHYREPSDLPKVALTIKVFFETSDKEEQAFEAEMVMPDSRSALPFDIVVKPEDRGGYRELVAGGAFSNIMFSEACRIKVRVYRGDEEIRLGTLNVTSVNEDEFQKLVTDAALIDGADVPPPGNG